MIWIISILSLIAVWLDFTAYKRIYSRGKWPKTVLTAALTDDLLPLISLAIMFAVSDNPRCLIMISSWIMWFYMATVPTRMVVLLFGIWSRRRIWRIIGGVAAAAMLLALIYGTAVTRTDYRIERVTLQYDNLPEAFDGYTVALISDLHVGAMISPLKECRRIVGIIDSLDADLVVFCGDLINIRIEELTPEIREVLGSIAAHDGVVAVTGNHDTGVYIGDNARSPETETERLISLEREMGWKLLDNETAWIRRGNDSISVSGISFLPDWHRQRHSDDIDGVKLDPIYTDVGIEDFNITLSHIPQLWSRIIDTGKADLTLSGHIHAMQFKLPVGHRGISPAMLLYRRWSGLYSEQNACLYINDGIGCVGIPARIGACPEITFFRLKHSKK
ncbi:MAG: metallophosphoesterase family protein [Alistipes sp.]|nr:metallophosphoesterase family protein [Alistipes sp.]